jgi:tyrosyl-tRNA synthetase
MTRKEARNQAFVLIFEKGINNESVEDILEAAKECREFLEDEDGYTVKVFKGVFDNLEEIDAMDKWEGAKLNEAKEILAYELTKMIHGEEEADKARTASHALFGAGDSALTPSYTVTADMLQDAKIDVNSLLVLAKMVPSKSEGRRAIEQGGVSVDGEKISDVRACVTEEQLKAGVLIKRGKKSFGKFILG